MLERQAAKLIIKELRGRGGFDGLFDLIDRETIDEIEDAIAEIIARNCTIDDGFDGPTGFNADH